MTLVEQEFTKRNGEVAKTVTVAAVDDDDEDGIGDHSEPHIHVWWCLRVLPCRSISAYEKCVADC